MPAPGFALGVDFGSSNTVAVLRWPDGRAKPLLIDGSPLLPSAVYAEPSGALLVGRDAVHSARLDPARFEPNPKRRIDDGSVLLGDREVSIEDLIAAVLARVVEEATRTAGAAPGAVMLTCPAAWGATRRLVLSDAARAAGIADPRLVEEPVAAATYFTSVLGREVPIGSAVVVHDFGAGTFDASVVARTATSFEVLAVDGRGDIGGLDIDAAIMTRLGEVYREQAPDAWARLSEPSTVEDRRARLALWDDVRIAKERLSRAQSADLHVPIVDVDAHLTREELETLAQPLIEQTVRVTQGAMRWAKLAEGQLAGIFLVGGASRIPLVATLLHRTLGHPPTVIEQPELVVAEGSLHAGVFTPTDASATVNFTMPASLIAEAAALVPAASPTSPAPTSGAPTSGAPTSGAPAGVGADGGKWPQGRAIVPGARPPGAAARPSPVAATRPMPRTADAAPQQAMPVARPAAVAPRAPRRPEPRQAARSAPAGPSRTWRVIKALLVALLLIAAPLVAAYIAYQVADGAPLWPVRLNI